MLLRRYLAVVRLLLAADRDQLPMLLLNGLALPGTLAYFLERLATLSPVSAALYAKTFTLSLSAPLVQLGYGWLQDRTKRNRELLQTVQPSAWLYTAARMTTGVLGAVLLYGCLLALGRMTLFSFSLSSSLAVLLVVAVAALWLCALAAVIVERLSSASKSLTVVIWASFALIGVSPVLWRATAGPSVANDLQRLVPHGVLLSALEALLQPSGFSLGALATPMAVLVVTGVFLYRSVVYRCMAKCYSES
jgi:hypothetical protein